MQFHTPNQGPAIGPFASPQGVDAIDWRKSIEEQLEAMFDRQMELIAALDLMDGDPDLEPDLAGFDAGPNDDRESDYHTPVFNGTADDEPDQDSEPSLGAEEMAVPYVQAFGFVHVRPGWMTEKQFTDWRRSDVREMPGVTSQMDWGIGDRSDREDEHDGAEPVNEDGGSWSESASRHGRTDGDFGDEDSEPSLSLPEHINQERRIIESLDWRVLDGEADYVSRFGRGRGADDEPSSGSRSIRTAKGIEIDDPEGLEAGFDGIDHGIADQDGAQDPSLGFGGWGYDGSGNEIARRLLARR